MFPIPDPKGSCCGRATERVQGAVMGGLGSFFPSPPWQSVIKGKASCFCKRHAPSLNRALSELFGLLLLPHKATEKVEHGGAAQNLGSRSWSWALHTARDPHSEGRATAATPGLTA